MAVYLSNINLSGNQLQNATLHPTGTAPAGPAEGQVYFHTTTKDLWYYNGAQWAPVRVGGGEGLDLNNGAPGAPVYDIDFTATGLSVVTTNTSADLFAMYDDSTGGHRSITFGNLESNLTIANMIGGGTVGTVTSVVAGNGLDFTTFSTTGSIILGTPGSVTGASTNAVTATSHTHAFSAASTDLSDTANIVLNNQINTYTVGKQTFIASTSGTASIRIQTGIDPSAPVQGDIWMQSDNLKYRDSAATRTLTYVGGAFHDGFSDFVSAEHVNHSTISVSLSATTDETSVVGASQTIDGNVTFTVGIADNAIMPGTGGMIPVSGTTAQRVVRTGNFRYNSTDNIIEWHNGTGWIRPDTGGGETNQNAFSIVTGDTGTATSDAVSDTIAITGATGLKTTAVAGAAASLSIDYDIANVSNTATTTLDYLLLGDQSASDAIIKRDVASFITDRGIALLASPAFSGNPTSPTPTQGDNDTSIATTEFVTLAVQAATSSIDYKESSRVASTANISVTYSNTGGAANRGQITAVTDTVDGVSLAVGNRILLKDQTTGAQNGIWEVTTLGTGANGVWDRAADFDEDAEVTNGAYTFISEGTVNGASGWRLSTPDPIVIGGASGTSLTFDQVSGSGQYSAGDGLDLTGSVFSVNVDDTSIAIVTDTLEIKSTWPGQTAITTVGTLTTGSIGAGFTAIIDARLATITTANKVSGSAIQLSTDTAIENSTGLRLKSSIAGTGLTLVNSGGDQILVVATSSTTVSGTVELATVAETEAKSDTGRAVTPAGLATFGRKSVGNIGDAAATAIQYTHSLATNDVIVQLWSNTTDDQVFADVDRHDADSDIITITFASAPALNDIRVVVIG